MPDTDHDMELLKRHAAALAEHFTSVQIFCTRDADEEKEGGTVRCESGTGNWFARYGQVRNWITYQEEAERVHARKKDDDRDWL